MLWIRAVLTTWAFLWTIDAVEPLGVGLFEKAGAGILFTIVFMVIYCGVDHATREYLIPAVKESMERREKERETGPALGGGAPNDRDAAE